MTDRDSEGEVSTVDPLTWSGNSNRTSLSVVRDVITEEFDDKTWLVTEAVLSAHATLLLGDVQRCFGLILEGPSGSGKTTVLQLIKNLDETYRTDDITPAAFVSHDASKTEEELGEIDLLPRVKHKTILNPDMAGWFSGNQETIESRWSKMVTIMDGNGYITDSGAHGQRGYEGDYRFAAVAATTPIETRAWESMGHLGQRFVFHSVPRKEDRESIKRDLFGEQEYEQKLATSTKAIEQFIKRRWEEFGGYGNVTWPRDYDNEIQEAFLDLGKLISHARAPVVGEPEDQRRVTSTLMDLACGHALLCGRRKVTWDDMEVCGRVALSTIPNGRRPFVRALVDPNTKSTLKASDLKPLVEMSVPTIHDRMELLDQLGLGDHYELEDNNRGTQMIGLKEEFMWPNKIPFPKL